MSHYPDNFTGRLPGEFPSQRHAAEAERRADLQDASDRFTRAWNGIEQSLEVLEGAGDVFARRAQDIGHRPTKTEAEAMARFAARAERIQRRAAKLAAAMKKAA